MLRGLKTSTICMSCRSLRRARRVICIAQLDAVCVLCLLTCISDAVLQRYLTQKSLRTTLWETWRGRFADEKTDKERIGSLSETLKSAART